MIHTYIPDERIFQAALDSLSAQVAILDPSGHVIAENKAWKSLADEIDEFPVTGIGQSYFEACERAVEGGNTQAAEMRRALTLAEEADAILPMIQVSAEVGGEARWFDAYLSKYSEVGQAGVVVTLEDVTDHKTTENALAGSQLFVEKVLDTVPNIIYVYDLLERRTLYINDRVGPLLGYSSDEIQSMGDAVIPTLAHPYDLQPILDHHERLAKSQDDEIHRVEYRLKHATKGWRWFSSRDVVFDRLPDGSPRQMLGSAHDVTQMKEDEMRIEAYQARLRDVARQVGTVEEAERRRIASDLHDMIGQGLIALSLQLAAVKGAPEDADIRGQIDSVEEKIGEIVQATRGLTFEISPPVLYELGLSAAVNWLATQLEADHGLTVEVDALDKADCLDPESAALLFRGIRELLMNVVKHASTRAARVRIDRDQDQIVVDVDDQGTGFNPDRLDVVDNKNSGFGLFSLRERLAAAEGSLDVRSDPGVGTRVTMKARISS